MKIIKSKIKVIYEGPLQLSLLGISLLMFSINSTAGDKIIQGNGTHNMSSESVVKETSISEKTTTSYDWSGIYAGINLGAIWTGSHLNANNISLLPDDGTYSKNISSTDVNPGIQLGYLKQFTNNWVLGGEGDFTYPDSRSKFHQIYSQTGEFDNFNVHNNFQGSIRLRAGYSIDRFLPFVTAGFSVASLGLNYNNEHSETYSKTSTQIGWVLGAGLEYGVLENLSIRTEYLYTDYGNALNQNMSVINRFTDSAGSANATLYTNVLRAAVNYRF